MVHACVVAITLEWDTLQVTGYCVSCGHKLNIDVYRRHVQWYHEYYDAYFEGIIAIAMASTDYHST